MGRINIKSFEKHNHPMLFTIIIVLIIIQVSTLVFFMVQNSNLRDSLDNRINSLNDELSRIDSVYQSRFNDLSRSLLSTQSNLTAITGQINILKASTSSDFSGIVDNSVHSVVSIRTNIAQGTGFFISDEGYIVTNAHVLEDATYAEVIDYYKASRMAELIGFNNALDLAVLKVEHDQNDYLEFTDSVSVGEKVIAIGNPLGLSFSVSEGIISGVGRSVEGFSAEYVQTDVALNPGNSGGPLINKQGLVVGINNFKIGGAENIGFALPSRFIVSEINRMTNSSLVSLS